jgi:hypothetical protein
MHRRMLLALAALVGFTPVVARAQVINVTPLIGGYVPAGDWVELKTGAENVANRREGTRSLGLNLEFGSFRGSLAYASGMNIKNASRQDIGTGGVLGYAADLVVRPVMRMLVQPYIVGGVGQKLYKFDQASIEPPDFKSRQFAFHGGIGADVMLGSIGIVAEVTDFVSKGDRQNWNVHDAFAMVGLRLRVP